MEGDAAYFRRRAVEEDAAAACATHPNARQAHLELAGRYREFANAIDLRERALGLHLVVAA